MIEAIKDGFRRYADFKGCSTRSQFWNFVVATHLLIILLCVPAIVMVMELVQYVFESEAFLNTLEHGSPVPGATESVVEKLMAEYMAMNGMPMTAIAGLVLAGLVSLAVLVPSFAVTTRRLRDAGQSPWWILAPVCSMLPIPFVSSIAALLSLVVLVFCCMPTKPSLPPIGE